MPSSLSESKNLNAQGYSLTKLLKRLEDATARLEDLTIYQEEYISDKYGIQVNDNSEQVQPLEHEIVNNDIIKTIGDHQKRKDESFDKPKAIVEFDLFIDNKIKPLLELSEKIDTVVVDAVKLYIEAYTETSKFLQACNMAIKPDMQSADFAEALGPISAKIQEINEFKDFQRSSKYSSYLSSICEGFPVFSWVTTTTPQGLVDSYKEAAQFWTNRILKEFRESDPISVEWVNLYLSGFDELKQYIKEYQTTGPTFSSTSNLSLMDALNELSSKQNPVRTSAPPPPPPAPPAMVFEIKQDETKSAEAGDMTAVFAELNKGENITSGLKKVDKSELKKQKELKKTESKPISDSKPPAKPRKPQDISMKEPRKELVGNKWFVMDFINEPSPIVIEGAAIGESVFVGKCINSIIQVKGKVNSITFNECKSSSLVMESCVAGVDFIKCEKFGLQVDGYCPMITADKCDGGNVYLSKDSINAEISTSCTTAMNVNLPIGDDDEFVEFAIPEQLVHKFDLNKGKSGKFVSEVFEHAG
ncbi:related to Adenylyl cyclase-associated protein [Hanseniaspora guilliermondii]|uniref:Adenylyl cyclase-associated protein n=1 Tax=Hanseniaspora guilliermondii TaxID=56406 RepID=A0A1L0CNX6_9ASCO|nr:related to Adenylyl cyclase-associated protein [Hanseniaspora guilliermondii]